VKTLTVSIRVKDPEDEKTARRLANADGAYMALYEMQEQLFRPARKHGYRSEKLQQMLTDFPPAADLVEALEALFSEILYDHAVHLEDV
jgi:hypothetical protein